VFNLWNYFLILTLLKHLCIFESAEIEENSMKFREELMSTKLDEKFCDGINHGILFRNFDEINDEEGAIINWEIGRKSGKRTRIRLSPSIGMISSRESRFLAICLFPFGTKASGCPRSCRNTNLEFMRVTVLRVCCSYGTKADPLSRAFLCFRGKKGSEDNVDTANLSPKNSRIFDSTSAKSAAVWNLSNIVSSKDSLSKGSKTAVKLNSVPYCRRPLETQDTKWQFCGKQFRIAISKSRTDSKATFSRPSNLNEFLIL
jgi:hypothetical protein